MVDIFSKSKRSEVMSKIRGSGNKGTELALAIIFRKYGVAGWRRKQTLFGKPDFTFRRQRTVVFVDGCFWHCCPKHSKIPATNRAFWKKKLTSNKRRDLLVTKTLLSKGWHVIRIWEHEISGQIKITSKLRRVINMLKAEEVPER